MGPKFSRFLDSVGFFIDSLIHDNKLYESITNIKEKHDNIKQKKVSDKLFKNKEHQFLEFKRFIELYLEHDHSRVSIQSHIHNFVKECINTDIFTQNTKFTFTLNYAHHYTDHWEKHNFLKRFVKNHKFRVEDGNLLHFAAILASTEMIHTLIDKGYDIHQTDSQGKKPIDLLFYNENYLSQEEFNMLKKKLTPKPALKLV